MADLRIKHTEEMVGHGHGTKADTLNRAYNIEHEDDGTHTYIFIDRGDPADWDWEVGDFTTDATWRDLDCSSIVPAGAKAILFKLGLNDDAVQSNFQLRKKGNINEYNTAIARTQVGNVYLDAELICSCDTDRFVQYYGSNLAFINIDLVVRGWWK